jgi:hypothetical protein
MTIHHPRCKAVLVRAAVAALAALPFLGAHAALITFDFDGMGWRSNSSPSSNVSVQTYLRSLWAAAGETGDITVTGAGQLSNNQYTGDGHVVGPVETCKNARGVDYPCVVPATLGSTENGVQDGADPHPLGTTADLVDNYIVNAHGKDRIVVVFPAPIYFASFDYQIFPDGTCTDDVTGKCGGAGLPNWPDFRFVADNVQQFLTLATVPGAAGTYCESSVSNPSNAACEKAPQYLGVSGDWYFPDGVTRLEFVDWPRRIGIDNLLVDTECCREITVSEPGGIALLAVAAFSLLLVRRRAAL